MNDYTVTVNEYPIAIYEDTGITQFEPKFIKGISEEYLLGLNFELKSHKTTDFMKIVLVVCRLVRYREK